MKRWIRIGFKENPGYHPAPQFVPPHNLPAVAQVQACVSPLHANGADYVPASASTPTAFLASTGGTAVLGLGMAILAAALILWETAKGVRSTE